MTPDYKKACIEQEHEITEHLGDALYGYGPEGMPMWGDHVAVTLAMVAARRLRELSLALKQIADGNVRDAEGSGVSIPIPALVAQGIAYQAIQRSPTADNLIRDARRYRALANHSVIQDVRMDGTKIFRVRGIPGRHKSFDDAVDSLIKADEEHGNRTGPQHAEEIRAEEASGPEKGQQGDGHDRDAH